MLEDFVTCAIVVGYFAIAYYFAKFVRKQMVSFNPMIRLITLSFCYTLIFGLGIIGGGGDPGFAFPFPLLLTGLLYVWHWVEWKLFIRGFLIPLAFWWLLIFVVMFVFASIKKYRKPKANTTFK